MGMMRLPLIDSNDFKSIDFKQVNEMVDLFMENGFNYFDTAYPYHEGLSEVALRKCVVERYPRDSFVVADKLPLFSITEESQLEPIFIEQLERTGLDYFDYYLMHNVSGFSEAGWLDVDSFAFVNKKKEEGYIKHLGMSTHGDSEFLDNILTLHPEMEFVLLQINYLDWEDESIESMKCFEVAKKHNKPVFIMEPFKGGFLTDVPEDAEKLMKEYDSEASVGSWALRFVNDLDNVNVILTGASSLEQLRQNISDIENAKPLNEKEHEIIKEVADIINSNITVNCTKCRYCVDSCSESIDIAKLFDLYNKQKILNQDDWSQFGNAYVNYSKLPGVGIASDCIECELCIEECPQEIDIPNVLKEVASEFETEIYGFKN